MSAPEFPAITVDFPLLTFDEAAAVGRMVHDRWPIMAGGSAPLDADDMGWGDIVQFILRTSRDVADARVKGEGK